MFSRRIAVASQFLPSLLIAALGVLCTDATAQSCSFELDPTGISGGDFFGHSVAVHGSTAVIASRGDDDQGSGAGSVHVFERIGSEWLPGAELFASDAAAGDQFGYSMDFDGTTLVVGAPMAYFGTGAAYVFVRDAGSPLGWAEQGKLVPSVPASLMGFGRSVAVSADAVVVGAPRPINIFPNPGETYVYERTAGTWSEVARLFPNDSVGANWFGTSVAIDADRLVVGASHFETGTWDNSGAAYVFQRSGSGWIQEDKLQPAELAAYDYFGSGVAIAGDEVLAGGWGPDPGGVSGAGSAWIFTRTGTDWSQASRLTPPVLIEGDLAGGSVALTAGRAVLGANGGGRAYSFVGAGTSWSHEAIFEPDVPQDGDSFGYSVAVDEDTVVAGGHLHDGAASQSGTAYAYMLPGEGALAGCPPDLSVSLGGSHSLFIEAGAAFAGLPYWIFGSITGTTPGLTVDGLSLPLNYDGYFRFTLLHPNQAPLVNSFGVLDANGSGQAGFVLAPGSPPNYAGLDPHHAFLVFDPVLLIAVAASPAIQLELLP